MTICDAIIDASSPISLAALLDNSRATIKLLHDPMQSISTGSRPPLGTPCRQTMGAGHQAISLTHMIALIPT